MTLYYAQTVVYAKEIEVMFAFSTLVAYTVYGGTETCDIWVKSLTLPLSWQRLLVSAPNPSLTLI